MIHEWSPAVNELGDGGSDLADHFDHNTLISSCMMTAPCIFVERVSNPAFSECMNAVSGGGSGVF